MSLFVRPEFRKVCCDWLLAERTTRTRDTSSAVRCTCSIAQGGGALRPPQPESPRWSRSARACERAWSIAERISLGRDPRDVARMSLASSAPSAEGSLDEAWFAFQTSPPDAERAGRLLRALDAVAQELQERIVDINFAELGPEDGVRQGAAEELRRMQERAADLGGRCQAISEAGALPEAVCARLQADFAAVEREAGRLAAPAAAGCDASQHASEVVASFAFGWVASLLALPCCSREPNWSLGFRAEGARLVHLSASESLSAPCRWAKPAAESSSSSASTHSPPCSFSSLEILHNALERYNHSPISSSSSEASFSCLRTAAGGRSPAGARPSASKVVRFAVDDGDGSDLEA